MRKKIDSEDLALYSAALRRMSFDTVVVVGCDNRYVAGRLSRESLVRKMTVLEIDGRRAICARNALHMTGKISVVNSDVFLHSLDYSHCTVVCNAPQLPLRYFSAVEQKNVGARRYHVGGKTGTEYYLELLRKIGGEASCEVEVFISVLDFFPLLKFKRDLEDLGVCVHRVSRFRRRSGRISRRVNGNRVVRGEIWRLRVYARI